MAFSEQTVQTYIRQGVEGKNGIIRADQYNQVYYSGSIDRYLSVMFQPIMVLGYESAWETNSYNELIFEPKENESGVVGVYYTKPANTTIGGFDYRDENGNSVFSEPIDFNVVPLGCYNNNAGTPFPPDWIKAPISICVVLMAQYTADMQTVRLGFGLCGSITDDAKAYYPPLAPWLKFGDLSTDPDIQEWFDELLNGDYWEPGNAAPKEEGGSRGGDGYFYKGNEGVGFPSVPTISAASSGFMSVYAVDSGNLQSLANELWTTGGSSFFDTVVKNYASPFENIISVGMIPFADIVTVQQNIKIGNYQSAVIGNKLSTTFYEVDCGIKNIEEYYNTFADYNGFTKLSLFLPFCGFMDVNINEFQNGSMWIKYMIDVLSGAVVANVAALNKGEWQIVYSKEGNFKAEIPISGSNYLQFLAGEMGAVAQIGMGFVHQNPAAIGGGIVNAISAKPSYQRSGSISATSGFMGVRNPYLVFELPDMWIPPNFKHLKGYKSNHKCRIGDESGYIRASVQNEELIDLDLTDSEMNEVRAALAEGIYI